MCAFFVFVVKFAVGQRLILQKCPSTLIQNVVMIL